ncbi:radical SAM protein [Solidesulfovibrio carbinolicus]|uniref:Radical SAM core domain-containing protein n=1 Tax=Solidesulfovibrio carbinolicus TaxID=296842 RepID=A0A4P6I0B0_9BACT|nr:radical SAM protein [Solidesulfovibrio carbinolicus]QAZ67139.1 hypothetical protein C3Y92_07810 [Solidesulfovibrio carbinolicus]
MDTVADAIADAAIFGADTVIVQAGIVDCFPRISSREDRERLNSLRPELRDVIRKFLRENRDAVLAEAGSVVYTSLETYRDSALQAAMLAQRLGLNIIFLSIVAHSDLEYATPGVMNNVEQYNNALREVCALTECAEYFDLTEFSKDKELLHDDLYHISPQGNARLALLMRNHLVRPASCASTGGQAEGKKLQAFVKARAEVLHVLGGVLAKAGHTARADAAEKAAAQTIIHFPSRRTGNIPTSAFIEITNHCNLNCTMCNTQMSKRMKGFMSPEVFDKVIARLQSVGIYRAALHTVGETLLHPNLGDLLGIARKRNFSVFFSTNGQLTGKLEKILPYYSGLFNSIRFSIDAATPETYALIRKGGKIERVWKSFQLIRDFNVAHGTNFGIVTNYILSDTNIGEIDSFIDHVSEFAPVDSMKFNLPNSLSPDPSFLKEIFSFHSLIYPTGYGCMLPFNTVAITFDGKVSLCCRDYDADLTIGSFLKDNPLGIWRGKQAEAIRQGVLGVGECPGLCAKCHNVSGSEISSMFIHNARALGLRDLGARLWSVLAAMAHDPYDLGGVRKACLNALS